MPSRRVSDLRLSLYDLNAQSDMDMAFKDVKIFPSRLLALLSDFTIFLGSLLCSFPSRDDERFIFERNKQQSRCMKRLRSA